MSKKKKPLRVKNMMYMQQIKHLPTGDTNKLVKLIKNKLKPKKWALIVHDKDTEDDGSPKEEHIHAMLSFANARSINAVAKILGDKPQYITAWRKGSSSGNGFAYLVHATDKSKSKYQYPPASVVANFDYTAELKNIESKVNRSKSNYGIETMLNALLEGTLSKAEIEDMLSGAQYAKSKGDIERVHSLYLQKRSNTWREEMLAQDRQVEFIWIYGSAGTGKTSLAKEIAKSRGQEYFVSGSSRDIFQGYAGEHTLILDEFRPKMIAYEDLLRITDPFALEAGVMAPARYADKPLSCDLVIVTSPFDPLNFFEAQIGKGNIQGGAYIDRFGQLLRRISTTITMTDTEILVAEYDEKKKLFVPNKATAKHNPYSAASRPAAKASSVAVFESIFNGTLNTNSDT